MFKSSLIFFFLALVSLATAIVWSPEITSPGSGTKWKAGGRYTVRWKKYVGNHSIPSGVKYAMAMNLAMGAIKLGYVEHGSSNEHLQWNLASNVELNKGFHSIRLPKNLKARKNYIIVLMGDSGNASHQFTIEG
ncbi:hypothetical protein DFQ29_004447 [Apophysomyces sp. BC1021]|nr:hypothetical protein DFQ29_004447 [Apophysomyces sp. BC1021]